MILEVAVLKVKKGGELHFERDFAIASQFIQSISGYVSHSLRKCLEEENKYLLLVDWEKLEDHTVGFRQSEALLRMEKIIASLLRSFPCCGAL